ncbi:nicotinate-nucleotide--dimethylbenzimidazole phosphoribosyltransferase [Stenotrophomonas maltophilia]|uniref:nicotinate-nucleotide--dimethylbenzimidazole phosphoribosyltransferase n=1 Tax=Stenotrophomonas maltophilia TaxID=40324 RepID=UPI003CCFF4C6
MDCGTVGEAYQYAGVARHCIRVGTANFAKQAAMNAVDCLAAFEFGFFSVDTAIS